MPAPRVEDWIAAAWDAGATDLHLTAGAPPTVRLAGELVPLEGAVALTPEATQQAAEELLGSRAGELTATASIDFGFTWRALARVRGNAYHQRWSTALALRLIPLRIPTPDELGLPAAVLDLVDVPSGLVLVTGPTGSGKSSTLASLVDVINRTRACHIITIEDPIEYLHRHQRAIVDQRQVGDDAESFGAALRSALRQDPDVVLLGEMRDLESIQTALTIAETGHLVLATLHTNDTAQAVDRIVDVFPGDRRPLIQLQLASTLRGIVYQRLVPRTGGGLAAAFEVLLASDAVRNLVREGKSRQLRNVLVTSRADGMQTIEDSLSQLVAGGVIDLPAARAASLHPDEIQTAAARPGRGSRR